MYQQELYEMLWLELQAWQAGMDSSTFDTHLIAQRHQVGPSHNRLYLEYCLSMISFPRRVS